MKKSQLRKFFTPVMIATLVLTPLTPSLTAYANKQNTTVSKSQLSFISIQQEAEQGRTTKTYSVSDSQAVQRLRNNGQNVPPDLLRASMLRKNGVSKIVKKKGYTYVYLSASLAKAIGNGGLGAAAILTIFSGGIAMPLALSVVSAIWSISSGYMNNGIWLKFKGFRLVGKGKQ